MPKNQLAYHGKVPKYLANLNQVPLSEPLGLSGQQDLKAEARRQREVLKAAICLNATKDRFVRTAVVHPIFEHRSAANDRFVRRADLDASCSEGRL